MLYYKIIVFIYIFLREEVLKKDPNKEQEGTNISGSIIDKLRENSDKIDYGIVYNKAEYGKIQINRIGGKYNGNN